MDVLSKIEQMVKSTIFDYAELSGKWKGFDVYRLMLNDSSRRTGVPMWILVDQSGECRFNDVDETFEIYDAVYA